jgi:hypothetical protein
MSFLDEIKQRALDVLHATTNAVHAQFAASLMQAGHDVTPDDHADVLMTSALNAAAATGKPVGTAAPNYADHAVATFSTNMSAALMQFASAFLPAKFQPVVAGAAQAVSDATADGKVTAGEAVDAGLKIAAAAAAAVSPAAGAIAAIVEPLAESVADKVASGTSVSDAAAPVVQAAAAAVQPAVTEAVTQATEAASEAVSAAVTSAFGKLTGGL